MSDTIDPTQQTSAIVDILGNMKLLLKLLPYWLLLLQGFP